MVKKRGKNNIKNGGCGGCPPALPDIMKITHQVLHFSSIIDRIFSLISKLGLNDEGFSWRAMSLWRQFMFYMP
jgi:hypothetical protein